MSQALTANQTTQEKIPGFSGFELKMIAVITMFIDHATASILLRLIRKNVAFVAANRNLWVHIYYVLRGVGRMAFPIYCFLLIEGFIHTRSRVKYARNMLLFALISEVPFDMAFQKKFWDMSDQNVYWELFLGLVMLCVINWERKKLEELQKPELLGRILSVIIAFGFAAFAEWVLTCDYGNAGILAIYVMYMLYTNRVWGFTLGVGVLACLSSPLELAALLMLYPIAKYNGTRGQSSVFMKYFFYAFYPVHLFLLAMICYWMGLGI